MVGYWVEVDAGGDACITVAACTVSECPRTSFTGESASQCKYNVVANLIDNVVATVVSSEDCVVSWH